MGERGTVADVAAVLAETLELLTVRPDGERGDGWVGEAPDWFGGYLFGGFVIAQAIIAATRDAPEGRRLHSMHAYVLRPVLAEKPVSYRVRPLREGRTFVARRAPMPGCSTTCTHSSTRAGAGCCAA